MKESRERYFPNLGQSLNLNPKRFWNLFKVKSKTSTIPQSVSWTIGNDTKVANNPTTIANMFNNYFSSVFTSQEDLQSNNATTTDINDTISSGSPTQSIDQLSVTESDVLRTLKSLDPDKALGPDEIPGRILKVTANQIAPSLTRLFNKSLQVGVVLVSFAACSQVRCFLPTHRLLSNLASQGLLLPHGATAKTLVPSGHVNS